MTASTGPMALHNFAGKATTFSFPNASCRLVISVGDITRCQSDAIVNAANNIMLGGGGVDGAIHRAAGPRLLEECKNLPEIERNVRCRTGEAVLLPGFRLRANYIIATVGPIFKDPDTSLPLLKRSFSSCLAIANANPTIRKIAFPAISCGAYGFPPKTAADASVEVFSSQVQRKDFKLTEINMVLANDNLKELWCAAAENMSLKRVE